MEKKDLETDQVENEKMFKRHQNYININKNDTILLSLREVRKISE